MVSLIWVMFAVSLLVGVFLFWVPLLNVVAWIMTVVFLFLGIVGWFIKPFVESYYCTNCRKQWHKGEIDNERNGNNG